MKEIRTAANAKSFSKENHPNDNATQAINAPIDPARRKILQDH